MAENDPLAMVRDDTGRIFPRAGYGSIGMGVTPLAGTSARRHLHGAVKS